MTRSQSVLQLSESFYNIPLPKSKVLAHIAGPSGSGKTEIAHKLTQDAPNIHFVDLDDFDYEAVSSLGWLDIPKNDYTDKMLRDLHRLIQQKVNTFIASSALPIVFVGHHEEAGYITKLSAPIKIVLNVSPKKATIRRATRFGYSKERIKQDINIGKEDLRFLRQHGYILMSPRQVYSMVMDWSKQLENGGHK